MTNRLIRKLGQVDRDIRDPYSPEHFTHLEVFVPKPTPEAPLPCIIVSIRNGHGKLFFRLVDVDSFIKAFELSARERDRLTSGLEAAGEQAEDIMAAAEAERLSRLRRRADLYLPPD